MRSVHDGAGNYVAAADSEALFGWSEAELLGNNAYAYFHPDDVDAIATSHDGVLQLGETLQVWYRIKCKDGSWKWVESRSNLADEGIVAHTTPWDGNHVAGARILPAGTAQR